MLERMYAINDSSWPSVRALARPGIIGPEVPAGGGCMPSRMTRMRFVGVSPVTAVLSISLTPPKGSGRAPSWQLAHAVAYIAAPVSLLGGSELAFAGALRSCGFVSEATYTA